MNYSVYFDIARDGYQGPGNEFLIPAAVILSIVLLAIDIYRYYKSRIFSVRSIMGIPLTILLFYGFYRMDNFFSDIKTGTYRMLTNALNSGNYRIAEGPVKNVHVRYGRINRQYFSVNNTDFEISDNELDGGFNQTIMNKGPLRENVYTRISYIESYGDKIIIRVELAQAQ